MLVIQSQALALGLPLFVKAPPPPLTSRWSKTSTQMSMIQSQTLTWLLMSAEPPPILIYWQDKNVSFDMGLLLSVKAHPPTLPTLTGRRSKTSAPMLVELYQVMVLMVLLLSVKAHPLPQPAGDQRHQLQCYTAAGPDGGTAVPAPPPPQLQPPSPPLPHQRPQLRC